MAEKSININDHVWVNMPGYIVYYTERTDGSGYDYWAVENPPAELVE